MSCAQDTGARAGRTVRDTRYQPGFSHPLAQPLGSAPLHTPLGDLGAQSDRETTSRQPALCEARFAVAAGVGIILTVSGGPDSRPCRNPDSSQRSGGGLSSGAR